MNVQDETGYSPLFVFFIFLFLIFNNSKCLNFRHAAASYENLDLIDYLIEVGADVNLRDGDGDTPLLLSESQYVFERLIQAGGMVLYRSK